MVSRPARSGVGVIAFGVLLDVVAHGVGDLMSAHLGHVVVIVGMVLSLASVVIGGTHQEARFRSKVAHTEVGHAIR